MTDMKFRVVSGNSTVLSYIGHLTYVLLVSVTAIMVYP